MQNYENVGVLGGGSWGTALAHILGSNGNKTLLWLRGEEACKEINATHKNSNYTGDHEISKNVVATNNIQEVVETSEIIVMAIPSKAFRKVAYEVGNFVQGDQIIISGCKGLEKETYARMTKIIREETCVKKIGVISGPNLALEVMEASPSATLIASYYHEVIHKAIQLFSSKTFKIYGSEDVNGVEWGGIIKNVIAIASGILNGLDFGMNTRAFLMTRGTMEMVKIGSVLGAKPSTFMGLAGIGDLIVTCSSSLSRNYQVGYQLSKGKKLSQILEEMKMVAEGVNTCKILNEFAKQKDIDVPIIRGVCEIIHNERNIDQVIGDLMSIKTEFEIDLKITESFFAK